MNDKIISLIYPFFLGRLKTYQNLSLIISMTTLLSAFILSWFDSDNLSSILTYLLVISGVMIIIFTFLSLPFLLFKKTELASIKNEIMFIQINNKPIEINIHKLKFLLNIEEDEFLISENLSEWGNYIIIPSEDLRQNSYIQFIPDVDLIETLLQNNITIYKRRSILKNKSIDLIKKFIWMIWAAS